MAGKIADLLIERKKKSGNHIVHISVILILFTYYLIFYL